MIQTVYGDIIDSLNRIKIIWLKKWRYQELTFVKHLLHQNIIVKIDNTNSIYDVNCFVIRALHVFTHLILTTTFFLDAETDTPKIK